MLKKVFLGLGAALLLFLLFVATRPAHFVVKRTAQIDAPAGIVFSQVNDFKRWPSWSPWEDRDPSMKRSYSGAQEGVGSSYAWTGNDEVGEGRMTITEAKPAQHITIDLVFLKPFAAKNRTDFGFSEAAGKTTVSWEMSGDNNFISKAICLFMDMDAMVGGDFEKGLAKLKTVSETAARATAP